MRTKKKRSVLVEPIFQTRFILFLLMIVFFAVMLSSAVIYVEILVPTSRIVETHGSIVVSQSRSLARLVEIVSDESLPAAQKAALLRSEVREISLRTGEGAASIQEASTRLSIRWPYVLAIGLAFLVSLGWGLFWSRRFVGAEMGVMRRLKDMVDGDLRSELTLRRHDELHFLRRGLTRTMDEMRSIVRRDRQLTDEVIETVEQVYKWVIDEERLSATGKARMAAAISKIHELERITDRYRLT